MDNYYFKHSTHFGDMFGLFEEFYRSKSLSDVVIACDGKSIHAHRIVLSAGSEYFRRILASVSNVQQYPVLIINDISYEDMQTIVEFIYRGQIVVRRDKVEPLRQAAYKLRIKGFENFLRKHYYANGNGMGNGNFKMSNGTLRNISLLNESKRMMQMNDAMESKKMKLSHNGELSRKDKDMLILKRFHEEKKRLSSSQLENALQRNGHSNGGSSKKINYEQVMRRNSHDSKQDTSNGELIDLKMKSESDSMTITAVNGDSHVNDTNDSCDESEDNHKNENTENGVSEKMNGKDNTNDDDCDDEDESHEVNYTYELDPNALTNWDSYNDENNPDGNNQSGDGYEDEEDYFESVNRNSLEMLFNSNNISKLNGFNNDLSQFYYCEHCPKYFFDEDHLQIHVKRSHGLNKLNVCNICGKTYAWKSGLYKHKRAIHNITTNKTLSNMNNVMEQNSIESKSVIISKND